jgi:Trk-type K+ transport system membrane component
MGAALPIFVLLSLSVFVMRVASVALRLTGLTDDIARFQALSAFTDTGFTTTEAESIVNYRVRRRIVSLLMIAGNLCLVRVLATLVVSLVNTEGDKDAVFAQLAWMIGGLILLWVVMLNAP